MNKNTDHYDLIIIGAGPSGICCALEAKEAGLSYLILEKGVLVNSLYNFPTNMTFFSTSLKLEIGDVPFISHNDKPTRMEALEYYRRVVRHYDLNIKYKEEVIEVHKDQNFQIKTKNHEYQASYVTLASGFYDHPRLMGVEGEHLKKVKHYYDDAHKYIGQNIIVVGGANSACDVALETWSKGAQVTMVIRNEELYQNVKYWILPNIQNRIKEGSIRAHFSSNIIKISDKSVEIKTPNGKIKIPNDYVLAMTGYKPNYELFKKLNILIDENNMNSPIFNPNTLESNVNNLYLAGVILGGMATSKLFIENTRHHGEIIIRDILSKKQTNSHDS
jgi:thioredoxin reductase (NADPH)